MTREEINEAADGLEYAAAQMRADARHFADHAAMCANRRAIARRYAALAKKLRKENQS